MPHIITEHNIDGSYNGVTSEGGQVHGLGRYCGRVLGIAGSEDYVIMPEMLQDRTPQVQRHYQRCGLSAPRSILWLDDPYQLDLGAFPDHRAAPFIMDERTARWSGELSWQAATAYADDKNNAIRLFRECGVPCPDTICFDAGEGAHRLSHFDGPRRFKPARGATNLDQFIVHSYSELMTECTQRGDHLLHEAFQLQCPIATVAEGSVQFQEESGEVSCLGVTGQYVGGGGHEGNFVPLLAIRHPQQVIVAAMKVARRLVLRGMKGYFSLDFLVDGEGSVFFTEINPRRTGSSTPSLIARQLGVTEWSNKLVRVGVSSLDELRLDTSVCFTPEAGEGLILTSAFMIEPEIQKAGVMVVAPKDRWSYWFGRAADWLESEDLAAMVA